VVCLVYGMIWVLMVLLVFVVYRVFVVWVVCMLVGLYLMCRVMFLKLDELFFLFDDVLDLLVE